IAVVNSCAFEDCGFGGLELPESLRYICKDAFSGCGELRGRLVLPQGLRAVGAGAFSYCSGLAGPLEIPDGTLSIGSWAFYGCSGLSSLEGGKGLVNIREQAFSGCTGLSGRFESSESLAVIGEGAFEGCTGITGAVFAGGIESIGPSAFRDTGCTSAVFEGAMPDLYGPDEDAPSFPEGCGIEAKEPLGRTQGQGWQVLTSPENGALSGAEREVPYDWTKGIGGTYAGTGRFADVGIEIIGREILITCNGRENGRISFEADPADEDQVIKTGEFTIKDLKIDELRACHGYGRCTVIVGKDASGKIIYFADENFGCDECVLISEELGMI
ncbi:MAG: leucine-rich repeat domain-containing protein, partial [Firmicutes bacterium]|nr:leucine-rich repeat domain-containing protein [Bacillota bacterium]